MNPMRLNVISMSGGKDSTATALLALETEPRESLRFVFADTGNEHPITHEYLTYLEQALDIQIVRLKVDFSEWMARRRMFVARDQRTGRKNGQRIRYTNKMKRRILAALRPSGNPYLDLCMIKGRFPSRRAQFCTQFLKTEPLVEYQMALIDEGHTIWSWQGVRRDESPNRANAVEFEEVGGGLYNYRPIVRWTAADTFEAMRAYGIEPNPLYKQGQGRVGCMPCINVGKIEIREIAARFPEQIERIAEWERMVNQTSKRGSASFFPAPDDGRGDRMGHNITSVVQWSKTSHGGKQYGLLESIESPACSSAYGLCE